MGELFELGLKSLSIAASVPAIFLSFHVVRHWAPEAKRAFVERRDAADWLVLGVTSSFLGIMLNMLYWTVWWLAHFGEGMELQSWMVENGSYFNLATRQLLVIVAAWCHLKAYHIHARGQSRDPGTYLWPLSLVTLTAQLAVMVLGGMHV